jgi:cytidylate kinase
MVTITISGKPGSGKSTIANLLKDKLNLKYIYAGMLFREQARKHNMSLEEFGKYCEKNKLIDKGLDEYQLKILKKGNVILEGRLSGWLAAKNNIKAFKIMLDANINTRSKRIVQREHGNIKLRHNQIIEREKSEVRRYMKYYNIDLNSTCIYDLIIDTGNKTPEEVVNIIIMELNKLKK